MREGVTEREVCTSDLKEGRKEASHVDLWEERSRGAKSRCRCLREQPVGHAGSTSESQRTCRRAIKGEGIRTSQVTDSEAGNPCRPL